MSEHDDGMRSAWQVTLASMGAADALDRIRLVGDRGIKHRSLEVSGSDPAPGDDARGVWLAGGREAMRSGLNLLFDDVLGLQHRWLLPWLQGRWPRGPLTVLFPLGESADGLTLGLIAPLSPTRVALSEGPLPFDKASVAHFKTLHSATGAQGLSGCRLTFAQQDVTQVAIRWRLDRAGLKSAAAQNDLAEALDTHLLPLLDGLCEGLPDTPITLEAAYTPAPPTSLAVEVGPIPTGRVLGLQGALWGDEARQSLTEAARALSQRWTHRVRIELHADGVRKTKALLTTSDVNRAEW